MQVYVGQMFGIVQISMEDLVEEEKLDLGR